MGRFIAGADDIVPFSERRFGRDDRYVPPPDDGSVRAIDDAPEFTPVQSTRATVGYAHIKERR